MADNWIPTRGWMFDPSDTEMLDILEDYATGRASPPQATINFADVYGDINPSVFFARAVGDPSNPTVKYFVTTTKEISASRFSKSFWKEDSQPIGIINEATGEKRGFKKRMKLQMDNSRWIMMEYSLNSNIPGVQEDLKNEVICRVRRIPTNNPEAQAQAQQQ
ncbi:uncharacterized protein LOC132618298 [Lycium barbarum]|uniref:uncharacterized protein LOC132618298 n=1 Tax=Lycium barbarum TaxID=112863 RepID=UPI00293F79E6|nr:uncharacterized protein LOC132618298 [Lycium barbarum]XP_060189350.1 uncharacterized protein LOC132618298 [Lycium barbarum]XP_060189351.1 uncharacterized protein LOC132618298 [Lycium barbarum]XP_060189352.1 uncharacterized protein LOC132618298 [Lycium barbarum]